MHVAGVTVTALNRSIQQSKLISQSRAQEAHVLRCFANVGTPLVSEGLDFVDTPHRLNLHCLWSWHAIHACHLTLRLTSKSDL
jgi:hypothetical protein